MTDATRWTTITAADEVTEELLEYALSVTDDRYGDEARIDWDDVLYRIEGYELPDGSQLDLGADVLSPAIKKIKAYVRKVRRESPR